MRSGGAGNSFRAIRWSSCRSRFRSRSSRPRRSSFAAPTRRLRSTPVCTPAHFSGRDRCESGRVRSDAGARTLSGAATRSSRRLPGVEHASISATVPFGMISLRRERAARRDASRAGCETRDRGGRPGLPRLGTASAPITSPPSGLPVLRGRAFTEAEATQPGGPAVAIIDEVLAKKLWPDGDALGQRIQFATATYRPPESASRRRDQARGTDRDHRHRPARLERLFEQQPRSDLSSLCARLPEQRLLLCEFRLAPAATKPTPPISCAERCKASIRRCRSSNRGPFKKHMDAQSAALDCPRRRGLVFHLRRARARAFRRRPLRSQSLLRRAAHPRDRHPHGARRGARDRAMDDPARRLRWSRPGSLSASSLPSAPAKSSAAFSFKSARSIRSPSRSRRSFWRSAALPPPGCQPAAPPASVRWPPSAPNERRNDETRSPKPEGMTKPETQILRARPSSFGLSALFRISDFGLLHFPL